MWPEADIYTAVYDEDGTEGRFADRVVHSSFLQRLRPSARTFRTLLPLYPAAIESFDLSSYELVVSSSSAWAHAVLCDEHTTHVSYCHNPFRYVWNDRDGTLARLRNAVARGLLRAAFRRWRQWDWIAAQRTNRYVANSQTTQARIRAYFGRDADIVYPPVETLRFTPGVGRGLLPARVRADAPQADRRRGRGLQPATPAARNRRRRPRRASAAAPGGTGGELCRTRLGRGGGRADGRAPARWSSRRSRSSASPPSRARRPAGR